MINPRKKSKYWVDDNSILPEIIITPQGNYPILDEAGNPARTVGAIQDINPNARIYERVNTQPFMDDYIEGETNAAANQRADALDAQVVPHIGDFVSVATKPLDVLMPSRWVGLLDKDYNGLSVGDRLTRLFDEHNKGLYINDNPAGLFSKRFHNEHPIWATAGNAAFDIASTPIIINGAKEAYNVGKTAVKNVPNAMQFLNSPYTGKWTRFGNREYRFKPGYVGMNGVPVESRNIDIVADKNTMQKLLKEYEDSKYKFRNTYKPNANLNFEINYNIPEIDYSNLVEDKFVNYLSKQTGKKLKRVPIKDTEHGDLYKEGFAFIDEDGKEIAHIAGNRLEDGNIWVESSSIAPEYRYKGLGPQMYYDFNDNIYNRYGTTLHSDPLQRVGSTGNGKSPSNRLWDKFVNEGAATYEGTGFRRHNVMALPYKISPLYKNGTPIESRSPKIIEGNANMIDAPIHVVRTPEEMPQIVRFQGDSSIPYDMTANADYFIKQNLKKYDPVTRTMVSRGYKKIDEIPNLRETINNITSTITEDQIRKEFLDSNYINGFIEDASRQGIDVSDLSTTDIAKILTEQYNQLSSASSGLLKDNILWRTWGNTLPQEYFDWQSHVSKFSGNRGFWGEGNYFSTGRFGTGTGSPNVPYMIKGIEEIGYDDLLGATDAAGNVIRKGGNAGGKLATQWMSEAPNTRMIAATPNGMRNKYGWLSTGEPGIEVVTQKNTGIKSLYPDLTIGNGTTFPRNWENGNTMRSIFPWLLGAGAGTAYGVSNQSDQQIQVQKFGGRILPPWHK